jgi:hypothetical protein
MHFDFVFLNDFFRKHETLGNLFKTFFCQGLKKFLWRAPIPSILLSSDHAHSIASNCPIFVLARASPSRGFEYQ